MRKFSSYGPPNNKLHYYAPRKALLANVLTQLKSDEPDEGGHYITVWAPRQTGKTWIMREVVLTLKQDSQFDVVILSLQHLSMTTDVNRVAQLIALEFMEQLAIEKLTINTLDDFYQLFKQETLTKPLILILDEFDALPNKAISGLVSIFRNIYNIRQIQADKPTAKKSYLLHGVALVGVRAVLGVENVKGSPFNVQRGIHIPNLTFMEVENMFTSYQQESGQPIEQEVINRLFYELQGQPGLTSWFGELLTETYNKTPTKPITMAHFDLVFRRALDQLPNNNILNIISKARQEPYKALVLKLFKTDEKNNFAYDDPELNYLYLNGVIDIEETDEKTYVKFSCPFVQKRLFNAFARELFEYVGKLYAPFEDLSDIITEESLNIKALMRRYESYLQQNQSWLLKDAPRRHDLRIYEAIYHFLLYMYLTDFLKHFKGQVFPEFPTGNGQIDLMIKHGKQIYGLEVKSFTNRSEYKNALKQATQYGQQLGIKEIELIFFVESVDDENRQKYEQVYCDEETGIIVNPIFVTIGQ
jgi:hypothetical protein